MKLASDACLIEINLDVSRGRNLFRPVAVEADADQDVTGQHPCPIGSGTLFDPSGYDSFVRIGPLNPVPWWYLVPDPLAEVEQTGTDQQHCAD
jgi:hypothetical protein